MQTSMQTRTFLVNKFQIKHLRKFWSSNLWIYWTFLKNLGTPWYWWYDMTYNPCWFLENLQNVKQNDRLFCESPYCPPRYEVAGLRFEFPHILAILSSFDNCLACRRLWCLRWWVHQPLHHVEQTEARTCAVFKCCLILTLLSNLVSMLCRQGFQLFRETCIFTLWPKINNDQIEHDPITAVLVSPTTLIQQRLISAKPWL